MRIVVGIIGKSASGKGTLIEILRQCAEKDGLSVSSCKFSDAIRDVIAEIEGTPAVRNATTEILQYYGREYADEIGWRMRTTIARCGTRADVVCVDGVRWPRDVDLIREFPAHMFVYIVAPPEQRFANMRRRGEKMGDAEKTWEQFQREDAAENEKYIEQIGNDADAVFLNNDSVERLSSHIAHFWRACMRPRLE